jgi:ribosomal protein S18 acetylase RimI-like enzyme
MPNIRVVQEKDFEFIVDLWRACGLEHPNNDSESMMRRKFGYQRDLFLVAEMDSTLVGTVMGGYEGRRGWINLLGVDPDYQRQGIATALMKAVEGKLAELDCPKVNLQIRTTNLQAIEFYQKIGYGQDEVVSMGKKL